MSKSRKPAKMATKTLVFCSLFAALTIVLARLFGIPIMPDVRISLEAIPIMLTGFLFGPLAGGMVGFVADFLGSLMTFGFDPVLCLPPVLVGVLSGFMRQLLVKRVAFWKLLLIEIPIFAIAYVFWQSYALTLVFGGEGAFWANYVYRLGTRTLQFAPTVVVDCLLVYLMFRSNMFRRVGIWPLSKEDIRASRSAVYLFVSIILLAVQICLFVLDVVNGAPVLPLYIGGTWGVLNYILQFILMYMFAIAAAVIGAVGLLIRRKK